MDLSRRHLGAARSGLDVATVATLASPIARGPIEQGCSNGADSRPPMSTPVHSEPKDNPAGSRAFQPKAG